MNTTVVSALILSTIPLSSRVLFGFKDYLSSVSHHSFLCCISLSLGVAVIISICPCVIPCLVMIAFSIENEMTFFSPERVIVIFKVLTFVNVLKIMTEFVTTTSNNEVKNVRPKTNPNHPKNWYAPINQEYGWNNNSNNEEKSSKACLTMIWRLLWF